MNHWVAILTGDVIASQQAPLEQWMPDIKDLLSLFGQTSVDWDIIRGDQFQLRCSPKTAFLTVLILRSGFLCRTGLDLRIGIGLGSIDHAAERISESNGSAFVRSGAALDKKGKSKIRILSGKKYADGRWQLMLDLAEEVIERWTPVSAEVIHTAFLHPDWRQQQLSEHLDRSQSTISETLKRTGFDLLMRLDQHLREDIEKELIPRAL